MDFLKKTCLPYMINYRCGCAMLDVTKDVSCLVPGLETLSRTSRYFKSLQPHGGPIQYCHVPVPSPYKYTGLGQEGQLLKVKIGKKTNLY